MLSSEVMLLRQRSVLRYLQLLEAAHDTTWHSISAETDLPARFILCHPQWLEEPELHADGLGLRPFRGQGRGSHCQTEILWGYKCPLTEVPIECDHRFPSSLGGPALGTNQVWLCQVHNRWKAADLLAFPWELGEPAWVEDQVASFAGLVTPGSPIFR